MQAHGFRENEKLCSILQLNMQFCLCHLVETDILSFAIAMESQIGES